MTERDLGQQLAELPPEKRALLFEKLRRQKAAAGGATGGAAQAPALAPVARDAEHYPLSFAQQRLWFLYHYEPDSPEYNVPQAYRLHGALDPERLRRALEALVARHEVLRTCFRAIDGEGRQAVAAQAAPDLVLTDLSASPRGEAEDQAAAAMTADARTPFDLGVAPPLRAKLFRLAPDEHLLYLNVHHIAFDGWSQGVLVGELLELYRSLVAGRPPSLPELRVQYLDYALWQRAYLQGEVLERQLAYWKGRLEGTPPLELATDRSRPAVRTHDGTTRPVAIPAGLAGRLAELGRARGTTLFITLLAAFRALLHRYSGQSDFAIGTLIANRTRPELETLVGFFANTLALRGEVHPGESFAELLERERENTLEAYGHQDVPYEKVVTELQPERDLSRTPFFQVMLILQNAPGRADGAGAAGAPSEGDLSLEPLGVDSRTSKFDLTLYLTQGDNPARDGIDGFLEYNTDLFDGSTAERLVEHYLRLLEGVAADPARPLEDVELLTGEELETLARWNDTGADFPREATLHELFSRRAAADPDAVSLVAGDRRLTYGELEARTNRLARRLRSLGVGRGTFVGVCTDRSPAMLEAVLGVLKAGGAYLPMDPEYPNQRLAFMLEDTRAPVIVTLGKLLDKLPPFGARTVLLDREEAILAKLDDGPLAPLAGPGDLAYVIHTSGSTGKPKGVLVSHRAVVNFLASMARTPGFGAGDTLLAVTTLSFDIAGLELYLPLTTGGRLVVADRDTAAAGERLSAELTACGATVMQATPATWRMLLGAGWQGDVGLTILCGGEALPRDLSEQLLGKSKALWNVYGPTEATIWTTLHRVRRGDGAGGTVGIGRPLANTRAHVVDRRLRPVPVGVPGELLIAGEGLARGYLNRPALTAASFVPDPFATGAPGSAAGGRLYRTGDLVRRQEDGGLGFLGRIDHQVKVRGFRIELGEIEAVLLEHPAIRNAAVVVRRDDPASPRLAAYLVPAGKELPKVGELRDFLQKKVPEYMVPAIFMPLAELPLTPNGKVDRKALPKPDPKLLGSGKEYVAPRTPEEEALAAIWAEVLKLEKVGVLDDFFELGGDSLQVIRVVSKAKKADLALTTKQVFQNRTVEQLAKVVGASQVLAEQGPITGVIPMSPAQQHFLELHHTRPELHCLGAELVTKDGKAFDEAALRGALARLLEQHDSLRMHLEPHQGRHRLVGEAVLEPLPFSRIDVSDLRALDERERWRQETMRIWDFAAGFDLEAGPLFKAGLFDPGPGETQTLMLLGHFLVADIGSWQVILDDFDTLYRELCGGRVAKLPAKTTAFKQWVERLAARADSDAMRPERAYWLKEERKTTARMPFDFPDGVNRMKSAKSAGVELDEEQTAALLQKLPRVTGAQIDAILLTAVLFAFDEWTGCPALLIDLLGHGREPIFDDVDLTRTVGWLNTIFPAYLTLGESRDPVTALKWVNQQLRDIPHGGIGYGILRYLSRDPEVAARFAALPESEIFFNYFGPDHATELTALKKVDGFAGYGADGETRRLRPLAIGVYVQEDRMLIKWEYSTNLHRHETIEAVAENARRVLLRLIESLPRT